MNAVECKAYQCVCGNLFPGTTSGKVECEAHCRCTKCGKGPIGPAVSICNACHFEQRVQDEVKKRSGEYKAVRGSGEHKFDLGYDDVPTPFPDDHND